MNELHGPPTMSPDGRHIAWLSSGDSVPRLVLFDVAQRRVQSRVDGVPARVRAFTWSHVPGIGLALADAAGKEDRTLHRLRAGEWTMLYQTAGAQLRIAGLSDRRPDDVLIVTNARDAGRHDYALLSLRTRQRTSVIEGTACAACYFDADLRPRLLETVNSDGSRDLWHGEPARGKRFLHIPHEAVLVSRFSHFSTDGRLAYFVLPDGAAATRLVALRCTDGQPAAEEETVFSVRRADIVRISESPATRRPEYLVIERFRPRTVALSPSLGLPLGVLRRHLGAEPVILERRLGDRYWLVARHQADIDARYFVYQPDLDDLWPLSQARPGRRALPISCRAVDVPVRTGERAVTYVAGPRGAARGNPTVLVVHGGPWRRSGWTYEPRRAGLAAQGFTVLEPNFRGSTGLGADWINAADRQWGAAMQDDLEDTVDWAIRRGYADPARLALVGGSYGGYAVLQLAAMSSRRFRCVVATSPLTDLAGFVTDLPTPWRTATSMVRRRVGDPTLPGGLRELAWRSPVNHAKTLRCPVLLVHGTNDVRIPVTMSARMFMALARADRDATLALFEGEGHEIVGTANARARDELVAWFLSRHLLGTGEPTVPAGPPSLRIMRTPRGDAVTGDGRAVRC